MGEHVVALAAVDRSLVAVAGGKGANLGELTRIEGVDVPPGFVVTTTALRWADGGLPAGLVAEITDAVAGLGDGVPCAVRSSATAEDQPTASFAGQHDSYLGVVGAPAIVEHVRRCWASLHTDRAVAYRRRNGIDDRTVQMAVVVQELVAAEVSGVLFTADPASGNRRVTAIEAVPGLGEGLVSGRVAPDRYQVRDGAVVGRAVDPARAGRPTLTDAQAVALEQLGRRIEAHLGAPQDVEWCLADGRFRIVQSRPITTLFPVPASAADGEPHVYVSVGHQQMMTDPMKPLGLSLWQLQARPVMHEAAGRLFVEVTPLLASPATRAGLAALTTSDPLVGDALQTIVDREGFLPTVDEAAPAWTPAGAEPTTIPTDPAIVAELVARSDASLAATADALRGRTGAALFAAIRADVEEQKRVVFDPRAHQAIMAGMEATGWLNRTLHEWLGEKGLADVLSRSVPDNVTSCMGLALLDVADVVRRHPAVVALLEQVEDDVDLLALLPSVPGGDEAQDVLAAFLDEYGARGVGEIDLTRPRWREQPQALVPTILANVRAFEPGEADRRFARGAREAAATTADVLARLRALPDGEAKAAEAAAAIERLRTFVGYREHPKFAMVQRSARYKEALLVEIRRLVGAGVLREVDDAWFLRFEELEAAVRSGEADLAVVDERRAAFRVHEGLTPPRVLTSEGEAVAGAFHRDDVPEGALVGLAVSAGTVEGRARVVRDLAEADLQVGDILVTAFTDPSWSPLFVAAAGLVTEVGGLMTHGSVIAREYGLPAVVAVAGATQRIGDGQRIRVHGTEGYVELL